MRIASRPLFGGNGSHGSVRKTENFEAWMAPMQSPPHFTQLPSFDQEILLRTGDRFEVDTVSATPADGEPGTLFEQLEKVHRHVDASVTLRVFTEEDNA